MSVRDTVKVYVELLEEGSSAARGTQAIPLGDGKYKLLPAPDYDPEDEIWEFPPGSVVRCKMTKDATGEDIFLAVEKVG